jgi:hypothetical protein
VRRGAKTGSILVTIVTCSAWLAISNHCAIGAAAAEVKPAQNECPFHAKPDAPAKQKQASDSPCCKVLRAIAPQKHFTAKIFFVGRIDFAALVMPARPRIAFPVLQLDTGPPGKTSFVELTGSMRAHAPPVVA